MEVNTQPKLKHNSSKYSEERYTEIKKISTRIKGKYSGLIAGTLVNDDGLTTGHYKLTVIVDDLNSAVLNQTLTDIKLDISEIAYESSIKLGAEAMLASELWQGYVNYEEKIFELLRESLVVHDTGFLLPIQENLVKGKIRPTKESSNIFYLKSEKAMNNSSEHIRKAIIDLYWAVTDSAHAAIMVAGITPPSPSELSKHLQEQLVTRGVINPKSPLIIQEIYEKAKQIMHKERYQFTGEEYTQMLNSAEFFVDDMTQFVKKYSK